MARSLTPSDSFGPSKSSDGIRRYYKFSADAHHRIASAVFDDEPNLKVVWTPWQRVEVFAGLMQLERAGLMDDRQARRLFRLLENEVRFGYWPHREFSWTNAIRTTVTIASRHGRTLAVRGMDLFHVAIAKVLRTDAFLTFDADQRALALAAGLKVPKLN